MNGGVFGEFKTGCFYDCCFTVACFVLSGLTVFAQPDVSASCAALMVAETGELIYGKNEHDRRSMASTTKIMTSLLAIEALTPQRKITVSADMLNVEGTSMGLLPGDTVTLEGLVYGMLLQSGNDAANVTAITLGGNVENFVSMMNKRAGEIGMNDTHFETPSGLDSKNTIRRHMIWLCSDAQLSKIRNLPLFARKKCCCVLRQSAVSTHAHEPQPSIAYIR